MQSSKQRSTPTLPCMGGRHRGNSNDFAVGASPARSPLSGPPVDGRDLQGVNVLVLDFLLDALRLLLLHGEVLLRRINLASLSPHSCPIAH